MSHQNFDQSHEAAKNRMTNVNDNLKAVTLFVAPHSYTPLLHSLLPDFVMHPARQTSTEVFYTLSMCHAIVSITNHFATHLCYTPLLHAFGTCLCYTPLLHNVMLVMHLCYMCLLCPIVLI